MSKKTCQNCLYFDQCPYTRPCKYYSPIDEEEDAIDELIELGRARFNREWAAYLAESQDSDY